MASLAAGVFLLELDNRAVVRVCSRLTCFVFLQLFQFASLAQAQMQGNNSVCSAFQSESARLRCFQQLSGGSPTPLTPYCLPPTIQEMKRASQGHRVVVPCVGGASMVYN